MIKILLLATLLAQAAPSCQPRNEVIELLSKKYQEQSVGIGIVGRGNKVIELFTSENGKTWTIIVTDTNGISCLIGSGSDWQDKKIQIPGFDL